MPLRWGGTLKQCKEKKKKKKTQTETGTTTMTSGNTGTTDMTGGSTGMTAAGNSLSTPETIKQTLRSAMRHHTNTGPPPGGSGGGGGGFPGGGAPGGAGQPPAQPLQAQNPVPNNPDVKIMGSLPNEFLGDRVMAEDFIEEVKMYLCLNRDVAGYDSPIKKAAFTLTLIKGKETAGWVQAMGNFLDTLDPVHQNIPAVWDVFVTEFRDRFQDTQSDARARAELKNLKIKMPEIDKYISEFEDLVRRAGYQTGNTEVMELFMAGLPTSILKDVMQEIPHNYEELKQRAVNCTRSSVLVYNILQGRKDGQPIRGFQQNQRNNQQTPRPFTPQFYRGFQQNFQRQMFQPRPFNQGQGQGQPQPQRQFDSTNAPRWMANTPVPMDVDRARAPPQRGGGFNRGSFRGRAMQTGPPRGNTNGACFQCGQMGHFARNCPQRQRRPNTNANYSNLIDFNEDDTNSDMFEKEEPQNRVAFLKTQLNSMSLEEKGKLAEELGVSEDFQSA